MSHSNIQHRRTHNLLLISRLLSQRDAATPFTLVLDSLEQTAKPLVKEYVRRANLAKTHIIFLGFETIKPPAGVDSYIPCYNKTPSQISQAVNAAISSSILKRHHLLIIDTLHPLSTQSQQQHPTANFNLTHFLSSLIAPQPPPPPSSSSLPTIPSPTTSLIAIYHTDIPLPLPPPSQFYQPSPLSLLTYLATTILTTHSLSTLLAAKAAQDRSLAPPVYGLDESKEGVIIGLKPAKFTRHLPPEQCGVVLELEHRRKSGRGVREWYFLPSATATTPSPSQAQRTGTGVASFKENVSLLDDHPLFRPKKVEGEEVDAAGEALAGLTFELGLTERQRMEREGVVLPYFDAQRDGGGFGPGEGGRILYDLGAEDDFDEEEDEI